MLEHRVSRIHGRVPGSYPGRMPGGLLEVRCQDSCHGQLFIGRVGQKTDSFHGGHGSIIQVATQVIRFEKNQVDATQGNAFGSACLCSKTMQRGQGHALEFVYGSASMAHALRVGNPAGISPVGLPDGSYFDPATFCALQGQVYPATAFSSITHGFSFCRGLVEVEIPGSRGATSMENPLENGLATKYRPIIEIVNV